MRVSHQMRIRLLVLLTAILIIGPPILSLATRQIRPQIQVTELDSIEGVTGYSVDNSYFTPSRNIEIYSGNVLDSNVDWVLENGHHQFYLDKWGVESVVESQSGVNIQLAGYHKFQDNYFDSEVVFRGKPSFPVMNYSSIQVAIDLSVLQGSVNATLRFLFKDTNGNDWWEVNPTTRYLQAGEENTISLSPAFTNIIGNTSGWIIESAIEISIFSQVPAEVIISEVSITAESEVDLYPVSVDLQTLDSESLFSNPYMKRIGGYIREDWTVSTTASTYYLGAWLTNTGDEGDTSLVYIRRMNETFYLREGTYSGFMGWLEFDADDGTCSQREGVNVTFTVTADASTDVVVQIPATKLFLSTTPNFAYTRVEINSEYTSQLYYIDLPLLQTTYLYLPPLAEVEIWSAVMVYDYRYTDQTNRDFSLPAATAVSKDANSNLELVLVYPQLEVLGFSFTASFLLGAASLLGIIIIIGLSIRANKKWTKPKFRPSLIPLTAIFISIIMPWVNYSFATAANPETHIVGNIYIPLLTTFWSSVGSSLTLAPNSYLLPNLGVLALFFWLPVVFFLYQMVYKKKVISIRELHKKDSLTTSGLVLGPFVLGLYYLWFCINNVCSISIGLIATVAILPAWIVAWYLEGKEV